MAVLNSGILAAGQGVRGLRLPVPVRQHEGSGRGRRRPVRQGDARQARRQGHRRPGLLRAGLSRTHQRPPSGHKVEDIAGLKLRVIPNPINIDWVKALGANPTPLPFPELYSALEQGAVDGQENPVATSWRTSSYEVQKYMTLHQPPVQPAVGDRSARRSGTRCSADEQKMLQDAAPNGRGTSARVSRAAAASSTT